MKLREPGFFEMRGLEILVFCNWYDGLFSDAKMAGIELIHHGVRTVTNGDVRLKPAPGQWDPVPKLTDRKIDPASGRIEVFLEYPYQDFRYSIAAETSGDGVLLRVVLEKPLPEALEGIAGLNLEFLPSAYFGSSFYADGKAGLFPRYPSGPMAAAPSHVPHAYSNLSGTDEKYEPQPIASGASFVFAPENPERRVSVTSAGEELRLFDGRNTAQNGWFVLRSLIPRGRTGTVAEWRIEAGTVPGWIRKPSIAHSQAGYHPNGKKVAVLELDRNDPGTEIVRLLHVGRDGFFTEAASEKVSSRTPYLRYDYFRFDFSSVRDEGTYVLEYGGVRTRPFRIAKDVYETLWHPTLDVFLPVQMDHMFVREAYRVWHGAPHLDDARQAPAGHEHFDLYSMGKTTDTRFADGEHIPGLGIGGWFDAGDFDIRTQTQYAVLTDLVHVWERFRPLRDETTVVQDKRYVELHRPDGVPDLIQQIEHGALALLAQHRAVGHAIHGIVEPDLRQYAHLGDASTKTDNLPFNPALKPGETDGESSGTPDDRWAFTTRSTPLNYGSAAALAAASRALEGYSSVAGECRETAVRVWKEEHSHEPFLFSFGNTTGGRLEDEEFRAAVELLLTTGDEAYARRITEMLPVLEERFAVNARWAILALPLMEKTYARRIESMVERYARELHEVESRNPFGVPITEGGWAGNGTIIRFALTNYELHTAFPDLVGADSVYRGLDYLLGCHPDSDISFVSGVGARSKEVAYGNNRADFTFIPGGVVPGLLILKPDFPENKEDWPFLWGENEYVVNEGSGFIFLAHAVDNLLKGGKR